MKATEQYFLEVLFISMYFTVVRFISCTKVVLTFETVDETLKPNRSNQRN